MAVSTCSKQQQAEQAPNKHVLCESSQGGDTKLSGQDTELETDSISWRSFPEDVKP